MGAMGMPQPLGPGAAPAFYLSCRRVQCDSLAPPRSREQKAPWALWVCRNPWAQGLLLPFAYLGEGAM